MLFTNKRMIWYWILLIAGIVIFIGGVMDIIDPSISGIGGGLVGVAAIRLIQGTRYRKSKEFARHVDTACSDERNMFISSKAKAWAFYITILGLAITAVVMFIAKQTLYAQIAGCTVAAMVAVYWIMYMILLRKY